MHKLIAILVVLLMCCPISPWPHAVGPFATPYAIADDDDDDDDDGEESDTDDEEEADDDDTDDDESDDEEMEDNDEDTDDNGETDDEEEDEDDMDNDEGDNDTDEDEDDGDDDMDDMDEIPPINGAAQAALKAHALSRARGSLGRLSAALNAGLDNRETIASVLQPVDSTETPLADGDQDGGLLESPSDVEVSEAVEAGAVVAGSLAANQLSSEGGLAPSSVPEPGAWLLAAIGTLAAVWKRRRRA